MQCKLFVYLLVLLRMSNGQNISFKYYSHILLCQIMYSFIKMAEFKVVQASCYYVSMSRLSTHPLFTSLIIHPLDLVRVFFYQTRVGGGFPLQNSQSFSNWDTRPNYCSWLVENVNGMCVIWFWRTVTLATYTRWCCDLGKVWGRF